MLDSVASVCIHGHIHTLSRVSFFLPPPSTPPQKDSLPTTELRECLKVSQRRRQNFHLHVPTQVSPSQWGPLSWTIWLRTTPSLLHHLTPYAYIFSLSPLHRMEGPWAVISVHFPQSFIHSTKRVLDTQWNVYWKQWINAEIRGFMKKTSFALILKWWMVFRKKKKKNPKKQMLTWVGVRVDITGGGSSVTPVRGSLS